jgi:uncharacterized glyoxalase superfamily protein PhnB
VTTKATPSAAKLVPTLRYRDLAAAVEWLCIAFSFEKHHILAAEDGSIAVAQLAFGPNLVMLLPVGGSELDRVMKQPDEVGGVETQSCYLAVEDIDAHYATAKAAGAQLILDLKAYDNGGRGFSCRDPEGHIWNFGTYDPWNGEIVATSTPAKAELKPRSKGRAVGAIAAMLVMAAATGTGGWVLATLQQPAPGEEIVQLRDELSAAHKRTQLALDRAAQDSAALTQERNKREAIERSTQQVREELARRDSAKEAAERTARQLEAQLGEERRAKEAAQQGVKPAVEQATRQLEAQLGEERRAKEAVQQSVKAQIDQATRQLEARLAEERKAKEAAESAGKAAADQATRQVEAQLAEERRAKEAAERAAKFANDQIGRERTAKQIAQNAILAVQKQLALARAARQAAEQSAKEAAEALARERAAREAAERAAKEAQAKRSQSQGGDKGGSLPQDRSSRKVSTKSGTPGAAEPIPPLLP